MEKFGNICSRRGKTSGLDEVLLSPNFSIGLMRNFYEVLFLFHKLPGVAGIFSVLIKNILTSLEMLLIAQIFLTWSLTLPSKKTPEFFVYIELALWHSNARTKEELTLKQEPETCVCNLYE